MKNEVGNVYGKLLVTTYSHIDKHRMVHWNCCCSCGKVCTVVGMSLRNGDTKSCGCLAKEITSKRMKQRTGRKNSSYNSGLSFDKS